MDRGGEGGVDWGCSGVGSLLGVSGGQGGWGVVLFLLCIACRHGCVVKEEVLKEKKT